MDNLNRAISLLMKLIFSVADRQMIDKTVKEVIDLLEKAKKELG